MHVHLLYDTGSRSYSALLLFESADAIINSLPSSSNPAMNRFLKTVSPMKRCGYDVCSDVDTSTVHKLWLHSHC